MNFIFSMNIQDICIIQTWKINKSQQKCKIIEEILFPKTSKYFMHQWVFLNDTFKPDILMSRQTEWHISIQNSMQASFAEMSAYYESEMLEILCSSVLKYKKIFFYFNFLPGSGLWIIIFAGILSGFEMPYERYKNDIFYVNVWFMWTVDVLCVL